MASTHIPRRTFIGRTTAAVAGGALLSSGVVSPALARVRRPGGITALTGATVIDPERGTTRAGQTVVLRGDRIAGIGRVAAPADADVIELRGRYVIPGLADMHVHSLGDERISPPLYVAHGVTTVREMSGNPTAYNWRDRIEAGSLLGPRMLVASRIVDGSPSLWDPNVLPVLIAATPAEGRAAVRTVAAEGADFVKVYSRLSPQTHAAIVDEARRAGLTVAGHGPDELPVVRVSDSGQRSLEHVHAIGLSVSSQDAEIRRRLRAIRHTDGDYNAWFDQIHPIEWLASNTYSRSRAAAVFGRLRHNRTRVVPTLTMHDILDHPDDVSTDDPRLRYLPAGDRETFTWALDNFYRPNRTTDDKAQQVKLFEYRLRFVAALARAGVPLMAGTDTGTPYCFPGLSLHDELALMVRAGLSPLQALRTATVEPARFAGRSGELGTVRAGALADLVVLDANPLHDIHNTTRIDSVVVRGRVIDSAARAKMLADVEAAAAEQSGTTAGGCLCHAPR
jgi:Amidohydrolase family